MAVGSRDRTKEQHSAGISSCNHFHYGIGRVHNMSYQEYAQLGKNARSNNAQRNSRHVSSQGFEGEPRVRPDRPYTGSMASFSVPRRSTTPGHSSSSSVSTESLSPSNSASQKARLGGANKDSSSPTNSQWSDGSNRGLAFPHATPMPAQFIEEKKADLIDVPMPWPGNPCGSISLLGESTGRSV